MPMSSDLIIMLSTIIAVTLHIVRIGSMEDVIDEQRERIELLEIENSSLIDYTKGLCYEKDRIEDINNSASDEYGTKYEWVFIKSQQGDSKGVETHR